MKLNPDCVRDILMRIEEITDATTGFEYPDDCDDLLKKYSDNELRYHICQCDMSGFFTSCKEDMTGTIEIIDLHPKGHELIAKIRDNNNWGKVKKGLSVVRDYSLSALSAIAEGVTSAAISSYFSSETGLK